MSEEPNLCASCHRPLVIELEEDSEFEEEASKTPDDLELGCGCHFHWECMLEFCTQVATTLRCPSCSGNIADSTPGPASSSSTTGVEITIPALYTSENCFQEPTDLLPVLKEEAYFSDHPEARTAEAFHTAASRGDAEMLVEVLLRSPEQAAFNLSYRNHRDGTRKTALHLAVQHEQVDVFWLLMWLGTSLPAGQFPPGFHPHAEDYAEEILPRIRLLAPNDMVDLRHIIDSDGRTPADYAASGNEEIWGQMLESEVFHT